MTKASLAANNIGPKNARHSRRDVAFERDARRLGLAIKDALSSPKVNEDWISELVEECSDLDLFATAVHEAAHAVVALKFLGTCTEVVIHTPGQLRRTGQFGYALCSVSKDELDLAVYMAGYCAEELIFGTNSHDMLRGSPDLESAHRLADRMAKGAEGAFGSKLHDLLTAAAVNRGHERAMHCCNENIYPILAVAAALCELRSLGPQQVKDAICFGEQMQMQMQMQMLDESLDAFADEVDHATPAERFELLASPKYRLGDLVRCGGEIGKIIDVVVCGSFDEPVINYYWLDYGDRHGVATEFGVRSVF